MRPFVLILLPLLFIASTGIIYSGYLAWQVSCAGQLTCNPNVSNPISTNDPLFNLLTGNYTGFASSLQVLALSNSQTLPITIPTIPIPYPALGWPTVTWGSIYVNTCSFFGFSCAINIPIPFISNPTITWQNWNVNVGTINLPLPSALLTGVILGIIMLLISFGITVNIGILGGVGVGVSEQGAKTLQIIGVTILIWAFTSLFAGSWINSLPSPSNNVLNGVLLLCVVIGAYWQSQTEI